jgi:hypothetical protein
MVEFTEAKSLLDLIGLEREFEDALGRKVDLVTVASLSPYLRDQVMREAQVLYERAAQRPSLSTAHAIASVAVEMRITQVANAAKGVHALLPRDAIERVADHALEDVARQKLDATPRRPVNDVLEAEVGAVEE